MKNTIRKFCYYMEEKNGQIILIRFDKDQCYSQLKQLRDNPYYATDIINGYTNNGFDGYWGDKKIKFSNVNYVIPKNANDISNALKTLTPGTKVIVKNTGHDYIGRSYPTDNTLIIWTHKMDNIYWQSKDYVIDNKEHIMQKSNKKINFTHKEYCLENNCSKESLTNYGYVVVDAGVQWGKIFDYMLKNKGEDGEINIWVDSG